MNDFIYEYWNKTDLGRKMIKSDNVSDSDLLFLIPNNVKKRHGLPLTRIPGKRKREQKNKRRKFIMSFKLFGIIEEIIDETLCSKLSNDDFVNGFVNFKDVSLGDKVKDFSFEVKDEKFSQREKYFRYNLFDKSI